MTRQRLTLLAMALAAGCGARSSLEVPDVPPATSGPIPSEPVPCSDGTIALVRADPAILFVIDRSGSMVSHLDKTSTQTRWQILTDALSATLPPVDSTMEIGALLYPTQGGSLGTLSCSVPGSADLLPELNHVSALLDLMQSTKPGGATPTAGAINIAASALLGVRAASTARALVLATDGGPNCNDSLDPDTCRCALPNQDCHSSWQCIDDVRTANEIAEQNAAGLPTYVIGIQEEGDDEYTDILNAMADAGGRPQKGAGQHYYQARSADELNVALSVIRDQVTCTYLTTSVPGEQGTISVSIGGTVVPFDATGKQGWSWGNKENGEIVFATGACALAGAAKPGELVANVKCSGG